MANRLLSPEKQVLKESIINWIILLSAPEIKEGQTLSLLVSALVFATLKKISELEALANAPNYTILQNIEWCQNARRFFESINYQEGLDKAEKGLTDLLGYLDKGGCNE